MNDTQTITIKQYLERKRIEYREANGELVTRCLFNGYDDDSRANEAHLYFNIETSQYDCKKCGEKGNIFTLAKHLGDSISDIAFYPQTHPKSKPKTGKAKFNSSLVEKCHFALPNHIIEYLNDRGITNDTIQEYKLGWGKFYGKWWITIPIKDKGGNFVFFKLRQDPSVGSDKITYPKGISAQIYGWEVLGDNPDLIVVCEGELDRLLLMANDISAITSTHGAMTFKKEWAESMPKTTEVYICFDHDAPGENGAERVLRLLLEAGINNLHKISLPSEVGEKGDITDYIAKLGNDPISLFEYAKPYPEPIDASQFKPLSSHELIQTLGLTIKRDEENKLIAFLCQLSAYTASSQLNLSFNAPSSTGKSYIPTEIAQLFPAEDVMEVGYCSPTAFFHDAGVYDKEKQGYTVDLSRKILIFLDQPHLMLLEHLRPLLSHDKKEIRLKITDKSQKAGLRTKNIFLKGFPAVIFCTVGLKIDEQESTRFLLLSPEISQEKIREAVQEKIRKETDNEAYARFLDDSPERKLLKERIKAIKQENISSIKLSSPQKIEYMFCKRTKVFKPRHQRDINRVISLIKAFALLNLWFRDRDGSTIVANDDDIMEAFRVWDVISESQELNLPPYIHRIYTDVLIPAWQEKQDLGGKAIETPYLSGLTRQEVMEKHFQVTGRLLQDWFLRQQIIPMLENSGLINQEADPDDKRRMLIYPTTTLNILGTKNNSELRGGVNTNNKEVKKIS